MSAVSVAVLTVVAYLVVVGLLWRRNGVRYDAVADSRGTVIEGLVVPIAVGSVLLAAVTTALGWWGPVLGEGSGRGPTWTLAVPVALALAALAGLTTVDWRSPKVRTVLPALAVGCLLVGFAEELATRGHVLVGARESGIDEVAAALLTMVVFSLVHAMNVLFGQTRQQTLVPLALSFTAGAAFYVTRITTGSLVVCMLAHAVWVFGLLATSSTGRSPGRPQLALVVVTYALGLGALWFVAV